MKRRPRRTLEIYFVLYLASIVTLLTLANERNVKERQLTEALAALSRPDFRVGVERIALTYQYFPAGVVHDADQQVQQDTTNYITAQGSFDHADFSVVSVIDTLTGEVLPAEHLALEQTTPDSARFQWSPHVTGGNHVYRVTVRVTAFPKPPADIKDEAIRREIARAIVDRAATLSSEAVFTINAYALGLQVPTELPTGALVDVPFNINPRTDIVGAFVNVPWNNVIIVSGADVRSQLAKTVTASAGAVQVNITSSTTFDVSGLFSQEGTQEIDIEGTRLPDKKTIKAHFRVNVRPLPQPQFPRSLYAGEEYKFDINTKDIPAGQLALELTVGRVTKISRDMGQAIVTFTPDMGDLGETMKLTSFLNNRQVGQSSMIIVALPRPEILSIEPEGDGFVVTTRSYGHYGNQENRARLLVREGNVSEPEEITTMHRYDESLKAHYQKWHLSRKSEGSVTLTVYAIDARGLDYKSPDNTRNY